MPSFSGELPWRLVQTELSWSDLFITGSTREHLDEIRCCILHGRSLLDVLWMRPRLRRSWTGPASRSPNVAMIAAAIGSRPSAGGSTPPTIASTISRLCVSGMR